LFGKKRSVGLSRIFQAGNLNHKQTMKTTNKILAVIGTAAVFAGTSASAQTLIDQWNFNETSGTTAANAVGGGPSATLMGQAAFNGSGGVTLNGTTGTFINLGGNLLNGLTSVTFEGWFSYYQGNNNVHLFSFDDGTGNGTQNGGAWNGNYIRYNINNGTNLVEIPNLGNPYNTGTSGNGQVLGGAISQNTLHQAVFVYDPAGGVESLYLDGVLQSSATGTVAPISSIFDASGTLGRSPWWNDGDPYLNGTIDQFSIYGGALSGSQIATDFAAGPVPEPGTCSMLAGGFGLLLAGFRLRKNK
jgi:hypothetical protein